MLKMSVAIKLTVISSRIFRIDSSVALNIICDIMFKAITPSFLFFFLISSLIFCLLILGFSSRILSSVGCSLFSCKFVNDFQTCNKACSDNLKICATTSIAIIVYDLYSPFPYQFLYEMFNVL
ncbi:hypothetical protein pE33L54_0052 (plasmid) [Bacillus cereus E33L]|uniref:Uncharacterized protein n=1 Tax=Bacillus cereus (strain ZK / E33L) TaxID=288681 RepID=Q4V0V3_BACCZ|nr:hypothetical protein pE33L54_0052 [Bacillus cereus E33L]